MDDLKLMHIAIAEAKKGIARGQSPFGCAISRGGELLSATHNSVALDTDITAHAEINALRSACGTCGELLLTGAMVATTCEPCPMCMSALHWARVDTVFYGASIADARDAGFNELNLPAHKLLKLGGSPVKIVQSPLRNACVQLFRDWLEMDERIVY